MERVIIEDNVEGKISRGRSPSRWLDKIKIIRGFRFSETKQHKTTLLQVEKIHRKKAVVA